MWIQPGDCILLTSGKTRLQALAANMCAGVGGIDKAYVLETFVVDLNFSGDVAAVHCGYEKNEETVFELLQTKGGSQAKPNKTVRAVMVSSGDKESAKNGNKQGKGMCAGDDVSVVAMSAEKSLKLARMKRRLNGQGDSHSQCIPALRSISYRSK